MGLLCDIVRHTDHRLTLSQGENNGNLNDMLPGTMVQVCNPSTWKSEAGE